MHFEEKFKNKKFDFLEINILIFGHKRLEIILDTKKFSTLTNHVI